MLVKRQTIDIEPEHPAIYPVMHNTRRHTPLIPITGLVILLIAGGPFPGIAIQRESGGD
ncbi:MAG: hypothetical protein L6437_08710 [Kiritimatiellae bacterium]|nr:hypothetical protein [Verrucomicrobiota bacterium]MBU4367009.1 hypothetical protein [Verrucomicrobiota bacterium]MCG2660310.1 hypothetical protein [Kiritimatiellia bacterium]